MPGLFDILGLFMGDQAPTPNPNYKKNLDLDENGNFIDANGKQVPENIAQAPYNIPSIATRLLHPQVAQQEYALNNQQYNAGIANDILRNIGASNWKELGDSWKAPPENWNPRQASIMTNNNFDPANIALASRGAGSLFYNNPFREAQDQYLGLQESGRKRIADLVMGIPELSSLFQKSQYSLGTAQNTAELPNVQPAAALRGHEIAANDFLTPFRTSEEALRLQAGGKHYENILAPQVQYDLNEAIRNNAEADRYNSVVSRDLAFNKQQNVDRLSEIQRRGIGAELYSSQHPPIPQPFYLNDQGVTTRNPQGLTPMQQQMKLLQEPISSSPSAAAAAARAPLFHNAVSLNMPDKTTAPIPGNGPVRQPIAAHKPEEASAIGNKPVIANTHTDATVSGAADQGPDLEKIIPGLYAKFGNQWMKAFLDARRRAHDPNHPNNIINEYIKPALASPFVMPFVK